MPRTRWNRTAALLLGLALGAPPGGAQSPPARYRVEQVFRLETTTAQPQPSPGHVRPQPLTTAVEGRVHLLLEQRLEESSPMHGTWRFVVVEVDGPHAEPSGTASAETERALALGLAWMQQLQGQEFSGPLTELPVLPLGEAQPAWLTAWLRWAQTGAFAGVEEDPVDWSLSEATGADPEKETASYQVRWLRSEFRQVPCTVQQARWAVPVQAAPGSVSADLAAAGVQARTHFSGLSLEWVSQEDPALIYAERSGVREIFWKLENVASPQLRDLVFRLRFAVEVRVERLP